jgi:nucleoid-associated protein YgaU
VDNMIRPPKSVPGIHRESVPPPGRRPVSLPQRRIYTTREGDSLASIASAFYGDRHRWPDIFNANQTRINNPNVVPAGTTLNIP